MIDRPFPPVDVDDRIGGQFRVTIHVRAGDELGVTAAGAQFADERLQRAFFVDSFLVCHSTKIAPRRHGVWSLAARMGLLSRAADRYSAS